MVNLSDNSVPDRYGEKMSGMRTLPHKYLIAAVVIKESPECRHAEVARLQLDEWYARLSEATDKHPAVQAAKYGELESISSIGEAKALLYPQVSLALSGDFEKSVRISLLKNLSVST